ncbi:MAG: RDD family protein [Bacteroidota bacterium]
MDEQTIENYNYAGFWKRYAASIIDGVIIVFFTSSLRWLFADIFRVYPSFRLDYEESQNYSYFLWSFYLVFIRWCYFAGMESSPFQATIGKMMTGLFVTDEAGQRLEFGRATGRHFGKFLSGLILFVGYMMAGFTPRKQALHDQISGSLVLSK